MFGRVTSLQNQYVPCSNQYLKVGQLPSLFYKQNQNIWPGHKEVLVRTFYKN